jgi:hypothetical protein
MWFLLYELLFITVIVGIFLFSVDEIRRYQFMNKYKIILSILEHFLKISYQVIYNEQMIAYTSQGLTNIQKDQLETIERNFIKLTLEIMGTENEKNMICFYGTRNVLIKNIIFYFRQRLEQDEISKVLRTKMTNHE